MDDEEEEAPETRLPTRFDAGVFAVKRALLQVRRAAQDVTGGLPRHPRPPEDAGAFPYPLAVSRTALWTETRLAERRLQRGKAQNLRAAVRRLDGTVVPAGAVFSFWKQIGRATRQRGYVSGRELREGCLIPAVGGGLCQLSNALYDLALSSGCEIVERHPHTRAIPGSAAARGRDATVAWNYIDLRFRPRQTLRIEASLTADTLIVRFQSAEPSASPPVPARPERRRPIVLLDPGAHGCVSCGQTGCFRYEAGGEEHEGEEPVAFLLEEVWPEYRRFVLQERGAGDTLGLPIDGRRWRMERYAWETEGYAHVHTAGVGTLVRSLEARLAARRGPALARGAQLAGAQRLAALLARSALTSDHTHVVVAQTLLPFLWRGGHLGGRTFDVLMTRLPLALLQARLDAAHAAHPDRTLLADFRAPALVVEAETRALEAARRIVTPHAEIAACFGARAVLLPWETPALRLTPAGVTAAGARSIAFPGPTAARKGAYEVREAARRLGLEVVLLGADLEGPAFWEGVPTRRADRAALSSWLSGVAAVVQPSLVEDRPRALLQALAAGLPVITTAGAGLDPFTPGVALVPFGHRDALTAALQVAIPHAALPSSPSGRLLVPAVG